MKLYYVTGVPKGEQEKAAKRGLINTQERILDRLRLGIPSGRFNEKPHKRGK